MDHEKKADSLHERHRWLEIDNCLDADCWHWNRWRYAGLTCWRKAGPRRVAVAPAACPARQGLACRRKCALALADTERMRFCWNTNNKGRQRRTGLTWNCAIRKQRVWVPSPKLSVFNRWWQTLQWISKTRKTNSSKSIGNEYAFEFFWSKLSRYIDEVAKRFSFTEMLDSSLAI